MGDQSRVLKMIIAGDATGGQKALQDVAGESTKTAGSVETAGGRIKGAFSSMFGQLSSSGMLGPFESQISAATAALDHLAEKGSSTGKKLLGAGGAGLAAGGTLTALASGDIAAEQQLKAAIEATGQSYDDYEGRITKTVGSQVKFGNNAEEVYKALNTLTLATNDTGKSLDMMQLVTDLAAKKHIGLNEAATMVAKAYGGSGKLFKEFGISLDGATSSTKELAKAQQEAQKSNDSMLSAQNKLADLQERLAGKTHLTVSEHQQLEKAQTDVAVATDNNSASQEHLNKVQTDIANGTGGMTGKLDELSKKLTGQAAAAADTWGGKMKAAGTWIQNQVAQLGQEYGPALMAAGGAMSVLGGAVEGGSAILSKFRGVSEAATAASEAQATATGVVTAATEAETTAMDAAAVSEGIALGPILLIVAAIAALGIAAYLLWDNWDTVWGGIQEAPNAVLGFFESLPSHISDLAHGMWDGIGEAFKAVLNKIIGWWDDFSFPSVTLPGFLGGGTLGGWHLPQIPYLAEGGIALGPTLAVIGDNPARREAIVPLEKASEFGFGGGGGAPITVQVPLYIDGREFARATATFTRDELLRSRGNYVATGLS